MCHFYKLRNGALTSFLGSSPTLTAKVGMRENLRS